MITTNTNNPQSSLKNFDFETAQAIVLEKYGSTPEDAKKWALLTETTRSGISSAPDLVSPIHARITPKPLRGGKTTQTRCAQTTQRVFCIFDHTTAASFL